MEDQNVLSVFHGLVGQIDSAVDGIVAKLKEGFEQLPDEAAAAHKLEGIIKDEIGKVVPLATIEAFVNARIPMLLRPVAAIVEKNIIEKIEVDAIGLLVSFVRSRIDAKLGADWFAKLKAAV